MARILIPHFCNGLKITRNTSGLTPPTHDRYSMRANDLPLQSFATSDNSLLCILQTTEPPYLERKSCVCWHNLQFLSPYSVGNKKERSRLGLTRRTALHQQTASLCCANQLCVTCNLCVSIVCNRGFVGTLESIHLFYFNQVCASCETWET